MTYSIVARDPETGEMGVAVQTGIGGVGTLCPWAEAGIGAIATQALVRVSHGPSGLELLRNGHTAPQALEAVVKSDPDPHVRQIGMVDSQGNAMGFTGDNTIPYAGHKFDQNVSVQANMMAKATVPAAMFEAFQNTRGALYLRMMAALEAAEAEGGDFRGQQSAALKVVSGEVQKNRWMGILADLRVDDHPQAVAEMRRLVNRHHAHALLGKAYESATSGNFDQAMEQYQAAIATDPADIQSRFWFGLTLANEHGQKDLATPILREVFQHDPMWIECLRRYDQSRPLKTEGLVDELLRLGAGV